METPIPPLKLPLCQVDYQQALAQASTQSDPAIAQQITYGVLAALSARYYLKLLGIASELLEPQSVSAGVRALRITPASALRCVPVIAGQPLNHRSLHHKSSAAKGVDAQSLEAGCLGTLAVQLDISQRESKLLGFMPAECVAEQATEQTIEQFKSPVRVPTLQPLAALISRLSHSPITHLQRWLTGQVESGWQKISQSRARFAMCPSAQVPCFRSAVPPTPAMPPTEKSLLEVIHHSPDDEQRWQAAEQLWSLDPAHPSSPILRAKDLGLYLEGHTVTLLVGILTKLNQERLILVRLLPFGENPYLPCNLSLTGLNEAGDTVFSIQSRSQDDFIQFKFTAAAGDRFTLNISRNTASVTEHFIV